MKMNIEKLCVTDDNITIPRELHRVPVKTLFTTLINKEAWNSHDQQDSIEALVFIFFIIHFILLFLGLIIIFHIIVFQFTNTKEL